MLSRWVVRVGALLTILTIALDPFAQQLVQLGEELKSVEPDHSLRAEIKTAPGYNRIGEEFYTSFENITGSHFVPEVDTTCLVC